MKFIKWLDKNLEEFFMVIFLIILTCVMMTQVIMRYVFSSPLAWAEEACRYCFVYSVMLATGYCIRRGSMLKVDVVIRMFPEKAARILDMLAQLLAIAFCVIMLKPGWNIMYSAYSIGNVSPAMELPVWILYTCSPIGFFLGIVRGIQVFVISLKDFMKLGKEDKNA